MVMAIASLMAIRGRRLVIDDWRLTVDDWHAVVGLSSTTIDDGLLAKDE